MEGEVLTVSTHPAAQLENANGFLLYARNASLTRNLKLSLALQEGGVSPDEFLGLKNEVKISPQFVYFFFQPGIFLNYSRATMLSLCVCSISQKITNVET